MNYTQGFTRIWLALSLSWVFGVIGYHFDDIRNPKIAPYVYLYSPQNKTFLDISSEQELFKKLNKDKNYETYDADYREHYVYALAERKNAVEAMTNATSNQDASNRKSQFNSARTAVILDAALYALAPVLALLAFGFAMKWVFAGFKRPEPPKRLW